MSATLTIAGVDVSAQTIVDVTITAGRDDIDNQPDATVLNATVRGWRPAGQVRDPVTCSDSVGRMFAGTITDLATALEPMWSANLGAVEQVWVTKVTATGPLAELGRVIVGDEPWPQESDSQRIHRVLTLSGLGFSVDTAILGPAILPRDVDAKDAAGVARGTADDAFGILWEQPSDTSETAIRYQPARLRSWNPPTLSWGELPATLTWAAIDPTLTWATVGSGGGTLPGDPGTLHIPAAWVEAGITLTQAVGDVADTVRVTYGIAPEGEDRPYQEAGTGGPPVAAVTTDLATATDAANVADAIWRTRRSPPKWRMREARINLHQLPAGDVATLRDGLAVGTRITIDGIAYDSPTGQMWEGYLEGWRHEIAATEHVLWLRTSERALTEPADRWQDIPAGPWSSINPTLTWAEAINY